MFQALGFIGLGPHPGMHSEHAGLPNLGSQISLSLSRSMSCSGTLTAQERVSSARVRGVKSRHVTPTPLKSSEDDATPRRGPLLKARQISCQATSASCSRV